MFENVTWIQGFATACFALAIVHTFAAKSIHEMSHRYELDSVGDGFFRLLGEVEIVFGFWAGLFILFHTWMEGAESAITFVESLNFTEPMLIFVVMTICATRPILQLAEAGIQTFARIVPLPGMMPLYVSGLILGPLLGSLITEPAAMTVTALLFRNWFFKQNYSVRFKYWLLGSLFVNISIGGTLTHFAAPPVLMVANTWGWDTPFMFSVFGWKAACAVVLNTFLGVGLFWKELRRESWKLFVPQKTVAKVKAGKKVPILNPKDIPEWSLRVTHALFLAAVVFTSHYASVFMGIFLFFLGFTTITKKYQDDVSLKDGLLVAFFLGGLVVLGKPQAWWLDPLLREMSANLLFWGTTSLTAFTDNAAITYLGAQVSGLSDAMKYSLVAGAVTGGGLTVIANAPNPAGYSLLKESFGKDGISALGLVAGALIPTLIAALFFLLL
jgi:hypothetical protein